MARKKTNFKIMAECIKENCSISLRQGEKTELLTAKSQGIAYICLTALKETYKPEYWKLTIE